jgi:hypothetical protein
MAEACYTARATTKQQVLNGINKLILQTNEHGQYTHNAILLIQKGIRRVLVSQFNPSNPGKGMVKLLNDGDNILTRVQSTDAITAGSILKAARARAGDLSKTTGKTVLPIFTTQTEAQEEAGRLNVINQSVIGAKEGVVKAVSKLVGTDITDSILQTANGSDHKSINDFTLYEVMKGAIDGADRPTTNNVLEQLLEVINHTFDFRKKVSVNMELMQSNAARMASSLASHSSRSHYWPTSRQPPNPIMDADFDPPCMLSARSTHTIMYMMQRRSKPFSRSSWELTG